MFLVTMVFMVGLVFFVQQIFFGYSTMDVSEPLESDEYYLVENVRSSIGTILAASSSSQEADINLQEYIEFVKRESLKTGYELDLTYNLTYPDLEVTVNIIQADVTTNAVFRFP